MANVNPTARTVIASASLSAGNTAVGALDVRTTFGGIVTVKITNGATGPSTAPTVTINVSTDNSNWIKLTSTQSNLGNNVVTMMVFDISKTMYFQCSITGNVAQAVTVEALFHEITSIG